MGIYEPTESVTIPSANNAVGNKFDLKVHAVDEDGDVRVALTKNGREHAICYVKPEPLIDALVGLYMPVKKTVILPKKLGAVVRGTRNAEGVIRTFTRYTDSTEGLAWAAVGGQLYTTKGLLELGLDLTIVSEGVPS